MESLFEKLMDNLSTLSQEEMMEECMRMNPQIMRSIPKRIRILAVGFLQKLSLEDLNKMLKENNCEALYSRNYSEASLIYAFLHQLSFQEWKVLAERSNSHIDGVLPPRIYFGRKLYLGDLISFVGQRSFQDDSAWKTQTYTGRLNQELVQVEDENAFFEFLMENRQAFSKVRERARYYFCKYLMAYLQHYIQEFLEDQRKNHICRLLTINQKGLYGMSEKDFQSKAIRFSGIFHDFNSFFFSYIESDWMDILLEYYGNPSGLTDSETKELAQAIRSYQADWKDLSDQEAIRKMMQKAEENEKKLDALYASEKREKTSGGRSGEKMIRMILNGKIDLSRVALICYLLFFASVLSPEDPFYLDQDRLNHILKKCGFGTLNSREEFDDFVLQYMKSDDPVDYLMSTVTQYAMQHKNFYLYHMQYHTYSNHAMIKKFL